MHIAPPVIIDLINPYPPWLRRDEKVIQYCFGEGHNQINLAFVRPSMLVSGSCLGRFYHFTKIAVDGESVQESDLRVLSLFAHGPVFMRQITLTDDGSVRLVILRGQNRWWQLENSEQVEEVAFSGDLRKKTIELVQFKIFDDSGLKHCHAIARDILCLER